MHLEELSLAKAVIRRSRPTAEAQLDRRSRGLPVGLIEVYGNEAARNRALGPVGPELEFVACTLGEALAQDTPSELAVGHVAGEQEFEAVLAVVADRLAPLVPRTGPHRLIVARTGYAVDGHGQPLGALHLVPGPPPSEAVLVATSCAIWRALGERVPCEQSEETSRENRATSRRKNARR